MVESALLNAIRSSVAELVGHDAAVAVAYSGGLDSSIVAALAEEDVGVRCYCAAVPGSHDALTVKAHAEAEGRTLQLIELSDRQLLRMATEASAIVEHRDPVPIAYTVPLIAVVEAAQEMKVLAGNGADELFGGYAKYLTIPDPQKEMEADLEKALLEAKRLGTYCLIRGKVLGSPFLTDQMRQAARAIPVELKIRGPTRKPLLREVARELGLPSEHRPKKAAQYSSGVLKRMEKLAKADGRSLIEWCDSLMTSE